MRCPVFDDIQCALVQPHVIGTADRLCQSYSPKRSASKARGNEHCSSSRAHFLPTLICASLTWIGGYYWGQSARTHGPTRIVDTATLTQQNLPRLNLSSIRSRLHSLSSRLLTVTLNSIIVAHARNWLPQAAHAVAQSHTRGPGSGTLVI